TDFQLPEDMSHQHGHRCPHVADGPESPGSGGTRARGPSPQGSLHGHADEWEPRLQEDLAKRRLFIGGLPGMGEENQRENGCLILYAADLLPIETSWRGMPQSRLRFLRKYRARWRPCGSG